MSSPVTVKSPLKAVVASVIVRTVPFVFTIVAPLPKVISLPLTVKSPLKAVVASVIVNRLVLVFTIVAPFPKVIVLPPSVTPVPLTIRNCSASALFLNTKSLPACLSSNTTSFDTA